MFLIAFYLVTFLIIFFEPSTTLYFSMAVIFSLVAIYDFKFFIKRNIFFLILFAFVIYISNSNKDCYFKILYTAKGINTVVLSEKSLQSSKTNDLSISEKARKNKRKKY